MLWETRKQDHMNINHMKYLDFFFPLDFSHLISFSVAVKYILHNHVHPAITVKTTIYTVDQCTVTHFVGRIKWKG